MTRAWVIGAVLFAGVAFAQADLPSPDDTGTSPAAPSPVPTPPATAAPSPPAGDTIHFKSGGVLSGVQVLRETLDAYEVEVQEGVDPLTIPRHQVERIEYDDIDLLRLRRQQRLLGETGHAGDVVQGQEVSVELFEKLTAALPEEPVEYKDTDLVEVLRDLAERFQFKLEIDERVMQIPVEKRTVSLATGPGSTLVKVVRGSLLERFPSLEMVYRYDTVVITMRETGQEPAPPSSPAASEPPVDAADAPALPPDENETAGPVAGGESVQ